MDLDCFKSCCVSADFSRVIGDEVSSGSDSCSVLLFFFGPDHADSVVIHGGSAFGDLMLMNKENGSGSFYSVSNTLR